MEGEKHPRSFPYVFPYLLNEWHPDSVVSTGKLQRKFKLSGSGEKDIGDQEISWKVSVVLVKCPELKLWVVQTNLDLRSLGVFPTTGDCLDSFLERMAPVGLRSGSGWKRPKVGLSRDRVMTDGHSRYGLRTKGGVNETIGSFSKNKRVRLLCVFLRLGRTLVFIGWLPWYREEDSLALFGWKCGQ